MHSCFSNLHQDLKYTVPVAGSILMPSKEMTYTYDRDMYEGASPKYWITEGARINPVVEIDGEKTADLIVSYIKTSSTIKVLDLTDKK